MIKSVVAFILLLGLSLLALSAFADGISVSQSIDRTEIPFEGVAHLEITIKWNGPQSAYLFDQPLRPQFDRLKPLGFSSSIGSTGSGDDEITTKTYKYTLQPTQSGQGRIYAIPIEYLSWPDSIPGQLITEEMVIAVATPVPVEVSEELSVVWLAVIVMAVVLLVSGTWFWIRRSSKRAERPVEKSPAEVFLENLGILKEESSGDLKAFQTGLYKHLVTFLKSQYGIRGKGDSVNDIVAEIDALEWPDSQKEKVCGWLVRADKEKFTPVTTAPGETIRLETEIRAFIEKNMI
jgi:hypothetical protein